MLPCVSSVIDHSFLIKVKPQGVETKNTLKQFAYKTIGGPMGSQ